MEFFSLKSGPISNNDVVFREAWAKKLAACIFWFALTCIGGWFAWIERSWVVGVFPLLCLLLVVATLSSLRHALSPSNWLLRRQPGGLLIKYRSYMRGGGTDEPVVVRLGYDELQSAAKTVQRSVQRQVIPGDTMSQNSVATSTLTLLDLELKTADIEMLRSHVQAERNRYAITRGVFPVIVEDNRVRLVWKGGDSRITPAIETALASISATGQVRILQETIQQLDLVTDSHDREKQEAAVHQLLERGDRFGAIELAQKSHGSSMEEASRFVDNITKDKPR